MRQMQKEVRNIMFDLPYNCDYCKLQNNRLEAQFEKGGLWVRCKACRIGKFWKTMEEMKKIHEDIKQIQQNSLEP